jgi:hypothetical protein
MYVIARLFGTNVVLICKVLTIIREIMEGFVSMIMC